jgi:hypothetical protein
MAQEEVKSLLRQLKLPIDERGRRRAANRAEWFNQVNTPLELPDIFGAPQTSVGAPVDSCGQASLRPPSRTRNGPSTGGWLNTANTKISDS